MSSRIANAIIATAMPFTFCALLLPLAEHMTAPDSFITGLAIGLFGSFVIFVILEQAATMRGLR